MQSYNEDDSFQGLNHHRDATKRSYVHAADAAIPGMP
jgi:hypothetical protein